MFFLEFRGNIKFVVSSYKINEQQCGCIIEEINENVFVEKIVDVIWVDMLYFYSLLQIRKQRENVLENVSHCFLVEMMIHY